jgi:hypothetical protein
LATPAVEHGNGTRGMQLPAGLAEVEVGYLERLPAGRLREPVACVVRVVAEAQLAKR